jgi:hypothetical protein
MTANEWLELRQKCRELARDERAWERERRRLQAAHAEHRYTGCPECSGLVRPAESYAWNSRREARRERARIERHLAIADLADGVTR